MADRKALNHYYPPDFDPSKIPRRKAPKDQQQTVRLMAPYSMRCNTCGEYIYKGKKFNARKELVVGEDYYGIKIFRFYIKCTQCSAEITFKTDPKNADYTAEHGASRNFVPTKEDGDEEGEDKLLTEEEKLEKKLEKMEGDPMMQLEARTLDSRREMEILDALQDIRTRNARLERVDTDAVLAKLHSRSAGPSADGAPTAESIEQQEHAKAEQEDEALVQKYFGKALDGVASSNGSSNGVTVKRKLGEDAESEPDVHTLLAMKAASSKPVANPAVAAPAGKKKKNAPNAFGLVRKKK
ncbi:related to YJU2-Essential nuclear protein, putative spliceosomal component [Sporisorium reilianum SRZ2]|uniref:Splicing factor YJU2 n=1 Tax=Sporisorium reilianum (strain SRZ2) TaxID=999809 RepID=E6ZQ87_SPORE|nr:related to YJU2-Essential nuclear protein, putative spliceosomal component [Sporisorium reilianum SRZ2]